MPATHDIKQSDNTPVFGVKELSTRIKETLEERFGRLCVRGETSNVFRSARGHVYVRLKEGDSILEAVCWKNVAEASSMEWHDGIEVECVGRLSAYHGGSKYQLIIDEVTPSGEGALYRMLAERRKRLEGEGLFALERKRALPFLPSRIGLITSLQGAVLHDVLHRLRERCVRDVLIWPSQVQGDEAAATLCRALQGLGGRGGRGELGNRQGDGESVLLGVDVIILARGGGSIEDLWPFNEENVVRAIAACPVPVISAVGHETDWTLADLVADYRAPTPSAAAEKVVPVRVELLRRLRDQHALLAQRTVNVYERCGERERGLRARLPSPQTFFNACLQGWARHSDAFDKAWLHLVEGHERTCATQERLLENTSYRQVLKRGYAAVRRNDAQGTSIIMSRHACAGARDLSIEFHDGVVDASVTRGERHDGV
ncbi:MAG: exodeoxyribonuclease VII large subunit [Alphaproteobacteria bacterium GM202ARS2]|nr:exodeoxyribonuclease VII large subunit [Alphaproteobacteria bacterium GM202ARS2]